MTSSTVVRPKTSSSGTKGMRALATSLTVQGDAGSRLESRLVLLTVATRWVTVLAGILIGLLNLSTGKAGDFFLAAAVLLVLSAVATYEQLRSPSLRRVQVLTVVELLLTVGAISVTGAFKSPFIRTPITGLLLAG